jgi:hypothetical protein
MCSYVPIVVQKNGDGKFSCNRLTTIGTGGHKTANLCYLCPLNYHYENRNPS